MVSIKRELHQAKARLAGLGSNASLDAEVLMQHCLGKNLSWIMTQGEEAMGAGDSRRFSQYIERRLRGEPVAYITGCKEFWSLAIKVNRTVLIPRPETEHLVEQALHHVPKSGAWRILDLGTGSGAVAIAIAKERPQAVVTATDISSAALRLASDNARRLGVNSIRFLRSDWFSALGEQTFDVIVCNPPYIAEDDPCLNEPDLSFEPVSALKAGPQGLDALSVIGATARAHLKQNAWLMVEHSHDQRQAVASILETNGFKDAACYQDYAKRYRVTECRAAP